MPVIKQAIIAKGNVPELLREKRRQNRLLAVIAALLALIAAALLATG